MKTIKYVVMTEGQYDGSKSFEYTADNVIEEEVGDEYTFSDLVYDNVQRKVEQIDSKTFCTTYYDPCYEKNMKQYFVNLD